MNSKGNPELREVQQRTAQQQNKNLLDTHDKGFFFLFCSHRRLLPATFCGSFLRKKNRPSSWHGSLYNSAGKHEIFFMDVRGGPGPAVYPSFRYCSGAAGRTTTYRRRPNKPRGSGALLVCRRSKTETERSPSRSLRRRKRRSRQHWIIHGLRLLIVAVELEGSLHAESVLVRTPTEPLAAFRRWAPGQPGLGRHFETRNRVRVASCRRRAIGGFHTGPLKTKFKRSPARQVRNRRGGTHRAWAVIGIV